MTHFSIMQYPFPFFFFFLSGYCLIIGFTAFSDKMIWALRHSFPSKFVSMNLENNECCNINDAEVYQHKFVSIIPTIIYGFVICFLLFWQFRDKSPVVLIVKFNTIVFTKFGDEKHLRSNEKKKNSVKNEC